MNNHHSAFSLVEVTLALGVAAFCLLAIFGLLPVGLSANQATVQQTGAANLVAMVEADLRSTPVGSSTSPVYGFAFNSGTGAVYYFKGDGTRQAQAGGATYRLAVSTGTAAAMQATPVAVLVTWPAEADPGQAIGRFEAVTYMDRTQP